MDKPTLKEYLSGRNMGFVKTRDGRFYVITTFRKSFLIMISLTILFLTPALVMIYCDIPWNLEISHDLMLLGYVFVLSLQVLMYRFESFKRIEEEVELYKKATRKSYLNNGFVFYYATTAFMLLVFSLSSFSFAYMRSLLDTPVVECRIRMEETDESITLEANKDDPVITFHHDTAGELDVQLWINHTPYVPEFTLDGKTIKPYEQYQSSAFWFSKNYFSQHEYYTIDADDISNGSMLSVICGKWRYSWVFIVD